jgi:hypothetical protein
MYVDRASDARIGLLQLCAVDTSAVLGAEMRKSAVASTTYTVLQLNVRESGLPQINNLTMQSGRKSEIRNIETNNAIYSGQALCRIWSAATARNVLSGRDNK